MKELKLIQIVQLNIIKMIHLKCFLYKSMQKWHIK